MTARELIEKLRSIGRPDCPVYVVPGCLPVGSATWDKHDRSILIGPEDNSEGDE